MCLIDTLIEDLKLFTISVLTTIGAMTMSKILNKIIFSLAGYVLKNVSVSKESIDSLWDTVDVDDNNKITGEEIENYLALQKGKLV